MNPQTDRFTFYRKVAVFTLVFESMIDIDKQASSHSSLLNRGRSLFVLRMTRCSLPGMMELPGSFSGNEISPRPHLGPEPKNLRSLAIFIKETAITFKAPETLSKKLLMVFTFLYKCLAVFNPFSNGKIFWTSGLLNTHSNPMRPHVTISRRPKTLNRRF